MIDFGKLTVLLLSEGITAFNAVALHESLTEKTRGWAFAMRRELPLGSSTKVVIVLCADNLTDEVFNIVESEWVLTLPTAIKQAMRKHEMDPDRGNKMKHPLLSWLLRRWSGIATSVT
ncbi:MAG: hypothetical protein ABH810_03410 [bacterium]